MNYKYTNKIPCPGKATRGYDPSQDIVWLRSEIVRWIEGNLLEKWYSEESRIAIAALMISKGLNKTTSCCYQCVLPTHSKLLLISSSQKPMPLKPFRISFLAMEVHLKSLPVHSHASLSKSPWRTGPPKMLQL